MWSKTLVCLSECGSAALCRWKGKSSPPLSVSPLLERTWLHWSDRWFPARRWRGRRLKKKRRGAEVRVEGGELSDRYGNEVKRDSEKQTLPPPPQQKQGGWERGGVLIKHLSFQERALMLMTLKGWKGAGGGGGWVQSKGRRGAKDAHQSGTVVEKRRS